MRLIHGVFSRITHSTSLKRVFASFMGLVFAELVSFMGLISRTPHSTSFERHSASFMGFVSQVGIRPVKSTAIPWKPQWKPALYGLRKGSAFGGNQCGNLTFGNRPNW